MVVNSLFMSYNVLFPLELNCNFVLFGVTYRRSIELMVV